MVRGKGRREGEGGGRRKGEEHEEKERLVYSLFHPALCYSESISMQSATCLNREEKNGKIEGE